MLLQKNSPNQWVDEFTKPPPSPGQLPISATLAHSQLTLALHDRSEAITDSTPNLDLPYIMTAQAQKHVPHNEAIRRLDAIVQLSVIDRDLTIPPASPAGGERLIVAASASGEWTGHDGKIASACDWNCRGPVP